MEWSDNSFDNEMPFDYNIGIDAYNSFASYCLICCLSCFFFVSTHCNNFNYSFFFCIPA